MLVATQFPSKLQNILSMESDKLLIEFTWKGKGQSTAKIILKKNNKNNVGA